MFHGQTALVPKPCHDAEATPVLSMIDTQSTVGSVLVKWEDIADEGLWERGKKKHQKWMVEHQKYVDMMVKWQEK